jgi:hypothetical protein
MRSGSHRSSSSSNSGNGHNSGKDKHSLNIAGRVVNDRRLRRTL